MTVVKSKYKRRRNDLYETEPWVTKALLRHFPVKGLIVWEPAAGNHKIADVLKKAGAKVFTSDIATYKRRHSMVLDFFASGLSKSVRPCIITNPPWGKGNHTAAKFVRSALQRAPDLVAIFMTMKFDSGSTRVDLFRDNPRFAAKIVLLDRVAFFNGKTGTEDHAWYVWTKKRRKPPVIIYERRK